MIAGSSQVDTSALTGEPVPRSVEVGETVLAGMINKKGTLTVKVIKPLAESSIAKILDLVENATGKKAETEKFITTFARSYTPVVVFGALAVALLPPYTTRGEFFNMDLPCASTPCHLLSLCAGRQHSAWLLWWCWRGFSARDPGQRF